MGNRRYLKTSNILDERIVNFDADATLQKMNRDHNQTFFRSSPYQDALNAFEKPLSNPDSVADTEVRMGYGGNSGLVYTLNRDDLTVGHDRERVPSIPQHTDKTSRFDDFYVACFVHRVVEEQISGEHGHRSAMAGSVSAYPHFECRQKESKTALGQLLVNHLLALAACPEDVPFGRAQMGVIELLSFLSY